MRAPHDGTMDGRTLRGKTAMFLIMCVFMVVFIILFREFLVSALRMVAGAQGVVIAADKLGKWKTAVTMVSLCGYFVSFSAASIGFVYEAAWLLIVSGALMIAAVILTVISGVQYFWNGRSVIFS